jgi:hypothetical protein
MTQDIVTSDNTVDHFAVSVWASFRLLATCKQPRYDAAHDVRHATGFPCH